MMPQSQAIIAPSLNATKQMCPANNTAPQLDGQGGAAGTQQCAAQKLAALDISGGLQPKTLQQPLLTSCDLEGVAELIAAGKAQKIVVMAGAGISVSAGIPDFRSPGTGLYSQLQRFNLPYPEAVFDIRYFRHHPKPFCMLAKELWPGYHKHAPTPAHHFLRLLHERGLLLTVFTQNIDGLEEIAGLPAHKVVHAHGAFDGAHCIDCKRPASIYAVQAAVCDDSVPTCDACEGLVKPDITFFGEALPARFHRRRLSDLPQADLLLVMGTSLLVQPFAGMIDQVPAHTPRVLINLTRAGERKQQAVQQPMQQDKEQQQLRACGAKCLLLQRRNTSSSSLDSSSSSSSSATDCVAGSDSSSSDGSSSDTSEGDAECGLGSLSLPVTRSSSEVFSGSCEGCCCLAAATAAAAAEVGGEGEAAGVSDLPTAGQKVGSSNNGSSNGSSNNGSDGSRNGSSGSAGFDFEAQARDVLHLGDCDSAVQQLASLLGWQEQLQQLVEAGDAAFEEARSCWED